MPDKNIDPHQQVKLAILDEYLQQDFAEIPKYTEAELAQKRAQFNGTPIHVVLETYRGALREMQAQWLSGMAAVADGEDLESKIQMAQGMGMIRVAEVLRMDLELILDGADRADS